MSNETARIQCTECDYSHDFEGRKFNASPNARAYQYATRHEAQEGHKVEVERANVCPKLLVELYRWASENDLGIGVNGEGIGVSLHDPPRKQPYFTVGQSLRITVHRDGGMVLQGELVEVDREDGWIEVEGSRHAWDHDGAKEWQGRFGVDAEHFDVDGPLPE